LVFMLPPIVGGETIHNASKLKPSHHGSSHKRTIFKIRGVVY